MVSAGFYYGKPGLVTENGVPLDIGDDAMPYIGKEMISVADGTGGRSFEKQREINPLLLRRASSFETATAGCFQGEEETYREQYHRNFSYLYAIGDQYAAAGPRRSSYFGSRLTSIFMRYCLKKTLHAPPCEPFLHSLQSLQPEQRTGELEKLEGELAQRLKELLVKASVNCGLSMRTAGPNVSLMGTTYSGIVFHESEKEVAAFTVQAGDSLAIALVPERNEEHQPVLAFRVLLPPQERETDGGLINCIDASHDFYLRCAYHVLPKPCLLMVTSDGCFDAFPSMLHFEYFLMDQLGKEKSGELASTMERIRQYYAADPSNDDSSTMAICGFGPEAADFVPQMAHRRLKQLEKAYGKLLSNPEAFMREEAEVEEANRRINLEELAVLGKYTDVFWEKAEWLRQYCGQKAAEQAREGMAAQEAARRLYNERPIRYIRMFLRENPGQVEAAWLQQIGKELEAIHEKYRPTLERQKERETLFRRYRDEYERIMISRS